MKEKFSDIFSALLKGLSTILLIYIFLVSIDLLSSSFKLFGKPLANTLLNLTADPFVTLFIGIIATSIVQSSSFTTSLVVAMVSAGSLPFSAAVPIVMGANVGTSITNTLVSLAYMGRKDEFEKAFAAATVHDFFNLLSVLVFFPLQYFFHIFDKIAIPAASLFYGKSSVSGLKSPLSAILEPVIGAVINGLTLLSSKTWVVAICAAVIAFAGIFFTLTWLVKVIRSSVSGRVEKAINVIFGKAGFIVLLTGMFVTAVIQSSSVTTSLLIPLAGAGLLTLESVYPFTLGANIGTTVTAIIAALAGNMMGLAIAFTHLFFNMGGVFIFYGIKPMRKLPIGLARFLARMAIKNRFWVLIYILSVFILIPILIIAVRVFL